MKKLLLGLVFMLSGAIIIAGALIAGGSWAGGLGAGGRLFEIFESSEALGFTLIGALLFFIGLMVSISEVLNKTNE